MEYHPLPASNQLPTFIPPYIFRFFPGIFFFSCFLYSLPSESYTSDSSSLDSYNIPSLLNLIPLVFSPGVLTLLYLLGLCSLPSHSGSHSSQAATSLADCLHHFQVINKDSKWEKAQQQPLTPLQTPPWWVIAIYCAALFIIFYPIATLLFSKLL